MQLEDLGQNPSSFFFFFFFFLVDHGGRPSSVVRSIKKVPFGILSCAVLLACLSSLCLVYTVAFPPIFAARLPNKAHPRTAPDPKLCLNVACINPTPNQKIDCHKTSARGVVRPILYRQCKTNTTTVKNSHDLRPLARESSTIPLFLLSSTRRKSN